MFRLAFKRYSSSYAGIIPGQSLGGVGIRAAQRILDSGRASQVIILERSWDAVDRTRLLLAAIGDERISVRHAAARALFKPSNRPRNVA